MPGGRYNRRVIAHHLILTGYGHWLPNDPRGSGSDGVRNDQLRDLGPIHHGRKRVQPPRHEIREFYRQAEPRLKYTVIWFDTAKRQALGDAFGAVLQREGYTCYACAILRNHAHMLVRIHRDRAETMTDRLAHASRLRLRAYPEIVDDHPIWSDRPYTVFCYNPDDTWSRIRYIEQNPAKDGLPGQSWSFVSPYDNWPHHKRC